MTRLAIITLVVACSAAPVDRTPTTELVIDPVAAPASEAPPRVDTAGLAQPSPDEPSLYELDLTLHTAASAAIKLDVHRGHPTLIAMFYGSCATACPALIGYAKQIVAQTGKETRVLLVSFDSTRDTPARLRELADTHGLDERWTLAAANDTTARTLAAVLGIKYRASASGEYFHNSVITTLDRTGRPTARINGLGNGRELIAALGSAR